MRTGSQVASPKANQFEEGKEEEEPVRIWGRFLPLEEGADLGVHPCRRGEEGAAVAAGGGAWGVWPFGDEEGIDGGDVVLGVTAGRIGRTGIETPVARVCEN